MNSQQPVTPSQSDDPGAVLPPVQVPQTPPPIASSDDATTVDPPQQPDQTVPTDRALVPAPDEAADADLIEKEWVEKAKQIVAHTAEDPFNQQEALTKMKHDYLKKRYNKELGKKVL